MKVTLKDVWASQRALSKLSKVINIPIKTSYWIGKNSKKIMKEVEDIEAKRLELVMKYGKLDDATKQTTVTPENMDVFTKDFENLLKMEIELDIKKFTLEDFQDNNQLSGEDMLLLNFMFEEIN